MANRSEFIRAVRAKIDTPEKWCKGDFSTPDGRHCLAGAALAVISAEGMPSCIEPSVAKILGFKVMHDITQWNDAPERTHAEVLARLDEVINRD